MREAEVDTNESYIQEFIRDKFRFQWGLRGSVSRSQLQVTNIMPIRVNANGSPALVNGKLVRDAFRSIWAGISGLIFYATRINHYPEGRNVRGDKS